MKTDPKSSPLAGTGYALICEALFLSADAPVAEVLHAIDTLKHQSSTRKPRGVSLSNPKERIIEKPSGD